MTNLYADAKASEGKASTLWTACCTSRTALGNSDTYSAANAKALTPSDTNVELDGSNGCVDVATNYALGWQLIRFHASASGYWCNVARRPESVSQIRTQKHRPKQNAAEPPQQARGTPDLTSAQPPQATHSLWSARHLPSKTGNCVDCLPTKQI